MLDAARAKAPISKELMKKFWLSASILLGVALVVWMFFFYGPSQDISSNVGGGHIPAGPKLPGSTSLDHAGNRQSRQGEKRPSDRLGKDGPKKPIPNAGSAEYWKGDIVINTAKAELADALSQIEKRNSKPVFHGEYGTGEISGVAISAPKKEDIAAISETMAKILAGIPEDRRAEVRDRLEVVYKQYTNFKGQYRIICATLPKDGDDISLMVNEVNQIEDGMPSEDGSFRGNSLGSLTYTGGDQKTGWRSRYGYLFDLEAMERK